MPVEFETDRFTVHEENGRLLGQEKSAPVLKEDKVVLVQKLGEDLEESVSDAFDKIGAESIIKRGDPVAIKINLGGGIHYVPSTYSDPIICEAIIKKVKKLGGEPFVCEADMRARFVHDKVLRIRGYWDVLMRNNVEFVNLSRGPTVRMECLNLDIPLELPEVLLRPGVKILSFAPPKHHWECGITCNQKNMYGAIAEWRKSIYHRKYRRIDKAVAAASRIMSPDINILAAFQLGAGIGPHFCVPVEFNRMIVSKDMIRGDKAASEILGYPFRLVEYAMINTGGQDIAYELHPDSDWPGEEMLERIKKSSISPASVRFWKPALYPQYFVPHALQVAVYPHFEFIFTEINRLLFGSKVKR